MSPAASFLGRPVTPFVGTAGAVSQGTAPALQQSPLVIPKVAVGRSTPPLRRSDFSSILVAAEFRESVGQTPLPSTSGFSEESTPLGERGRALRMHCCSYVRTRETSTVSRESSAQQNKTKQNKNCTNCEKHQAFPRLDTESYTAARS